MRMDETTVPAGASTERALSRMLRQPVQMIHIITNDYDWLEADKRQLTPTQPQLLYTKPRLTRPWQKTDKQHQ